MERSTRVLIADDEPSARRGLRALLSLFPQVEVAGEAADGREALLLVEQQHPDVVLLDARMPVMDGIEATRAIKRRWPGVRVVVSTMHSSYRQEAIASGADAFLLKGCPPEALREAILARTDH